MEDFILVVAKLPWWGGVAAALVTYLLLHAFAVAPGTKPAVPMQTANDLAGQMLPILIGTFAYMAQFFVPPLCLVAAAISAWKARERQVW